MKSLLYFLACMALECLIACSSQKKNQTDDIRVLTEDSISANSMQHMPVSDTKIIINYKGRQYRSAVLREPDEKLSIVVNDQGTQFVDNHISLKLTCEGKVILDKVFTKDNFSALVDGDFLDNAILESLVYDKTTSQGIQYTASICYPQTDLYIPLSITVTPNGKLSMAKEELIEDLYNDSDSI
ncbi:MAG: DUF4738 domain-containing protein, partial [Bacteroides sp.]|nr:DUF4738 domain-containing protein [Bacteroides sp.]